jgi:hypothetical protein
MMHHVVQENLFNEFGFRDLLVALENNGCKYTVVKVLPHARKGGIIEHNFDESVHLAHELELPSDEAVMVWGATTLGHIAVEKGWKPGRFQNDKFDMRYLTKRFGPYMLNDDAQFCTFGELAFEGTKFIRPVHDSKSFSGTMIDGAELAEWKKRVEDTSDGYATLTMDTPVMYASPKKIDLEARFFIVDGTIVTGSSYRTLGRQIMYQRVDSNNPMFQPMVEFVKDMLAVDCTDESDTYDSTYAEPIEVAYVMDIGLVDGEYKVVEINTLNSAGFYASDMGAVVRALEALDGFV